MNILECKICENFFNSQTRKPLFITCGDTLCSTCIGQFIEKNITTCPYCQVPFERRESIDQYAPNRQIMQCLESLELTCSVHTDQLAISLNIGRVESLCSTCNNNNEVTIPFEHFSHTLDEALSKYQSLNLSELNQSKLKSLKNLSNKEKLILLKNIKSLMDKITCDNHNSEEAQFINLSTKDLLCERCIGPNKDLFMRIGEPGFLDKLILKVVWIRRAVERLDNLLLMSPMETLRNASEKDLVYAYKTLQLDIINRRASLKSSKCSRCNLPYGDSNEVWVFNCIGGHTLCAECKGRTLQVLCPVDGSLHNSNTLDLLFSEHNPVPSCPACCKDLDLKQRLPKELPCGHILCLDCVKNHLVTNNSNPVCLACKVSVANAKGLPSNSYLLKQVSKTVIYCSRHRNKLATSVDIKTLQSCCDKCSDYQISEKINFANPATSISQFLQKVFEDKSKNEEFRKEVNCDLNLFKSFSYQEMIDVIRGGVDPNSKDRLRSSIPKGRFLTDTDRNWAGKAVLIRFFSVMPPVDRNPNFEFVSKPWVVETNENQVEAVVIQAKKTIMLHGLIIGQALNNPQMKLDLIKILNGKSLNDKAVYTSELAVPFDRDGIYQTVLLRAPVEMLAQEFYSVIIRIRGDGVLMFRGNPFDLKEEFWGSDGTLFEFFEPDGVGDFNVNGQHDINGPILGLIYE